MARISRVRHLFVRIVSATDELLYVVGNQAHAIDLLFSEQSHRSLSTARVPCTPIARYPVVARWRADVDYVAAGIFCFQVSSLLFFMSFHTSRLAPESLHVYTCTYSHSV